nr:hypothetical protein [Nonomuraea turkmeniaca]
MDHHIAPNRRARISPDDLVGIGPSTFQLVDDTLMEYADTGEVCLQAHGLTVTVEDGKVLLDRATFPVGEKCPVSDHRPQRPGQLHPAARAHRAAPRGPGHGHVRRSTSISSSRTSRIRRTPCGARTWASGSWT